MLPQDHKASLSSGARDHTCTHADSSLLLLALIPLLWGPGLWNQIHSPIYLLCELRQSSYICKLGKTILHLCHGDRLF